MNKKTILVTGANGQVGQEIRALEGSYPAFSFLFVDLPEPDISDKKSATEYFKQHPVDIVINCAAYTAVDKAESEPEKAYAANATGVLNLAHVCAEYHIPFIHISTDFIFDGQKGNRYTEEDVANPLGVYASTKLEGEKLALSQHAQTIIVRTSWVYSPFGGNFVKTMLRLGKEKSELKVVNDQTGSPTYAHDLAEVLLTIAGKIESVKAYGIFHYSNGGAITRDEFAKTILQLKGIPTPVLPITTAEFPTAAKRPCYSVLNTNKIQQVYGIAIKDWKESLAACLQRI